MKKILIAMLLAVGCCAVQAGEAEAPKAPWQVTLGKVKDLSGDTGIAGFGKKDAPDYITGKFESKDAKGKWADRPEAPDFTKPLKPASAYANRNGFWVTAPAQAKAYSTKKHEVKLGDWVGGYFDDVGAFVPGHEVKTLFGMPYGIGQLIMIPICLILL